MGLVDEIRSPAATAAFHRAIAALIAVVGVAVTAINLATAPEYVRGSGGLTWLLAPQISTVFATSALAGVSALFPRLRWLDVVLIGGTGMAATYGADGADVTGVALMFVAIGVAAEYGYLSPRPRLKLAVSSAVVGVVVASSALISPTVSLGSTAKTVLMSVFLIGIGWQLVILRLRKERQRQRELETEVATRTAELSDSLAAQKLLLAEVHHRTKNNLQLVSSLLSLESHEAEGQSADSLDRAQTRIRALGRAHELLYTATTTETTDLGMYLSDYLYEISGLVEIRGLYIEPHIEVRRQAPLDRAIRLGLMVNEILLNAAEHATAENRTVILQLRVASHDEDLVIEAEDNGPGFHHRTTKHAGLGLNIVESLAQTLGGSVNLDGSNGVRWRIVIPWTALMQSGR